MLSLLANNNILNTKETLSSSPNFLNIKHDKENNLYITKLCHKSDTTQPLVKQCDGLVLNDTNNIVCYSGDYCEQVTVDTLQNKDSFDYDMYELLEGTCIRMYYHNNEWKTGTKGHTDASKSKWSSDKNFQELFNEALVNYPDFSTDTFDKNQTYVFLLQHIDNKIVCPCTENKIYLIDVYDNNTLTRVECVLSFVDSPKKLEFTLDQLKTFLTLGEETIKGVNLYSKTSNTRQCVLTELYENRQKLKGNTLNMEKQYLILRCGNTHYNFNKQFPEYTDMVQTLEANIRQNVNYIHGLYMKKHVKRQEVVLSPEEHKYIFAIHGFYLRTRNIITKPLVETLMFVINNQFGATDLTTNQNQNKE